MPEPRIVPWRSLAVTSPFPSGQTVPHLAKQRFGGHLFPKDFLLAPDSLG
jgi:hypothetical protein